MKKYSGYFLITDLDGTLLNTNKEISPDNQKALAEFTAQGGRFSVATGRSPASAGRWLRQLPINFPCVFYNGSMVKDVVKDEILHCDYLQSSYALSIVQWILKEHPKTIVEIFTDRGLFIISDPENKDPYLEDENDPYIQSCLAEVKDEQWIKILLCDDHAALEEIRSYMDGRHLDEQCYYFYSQDFFLEITPKNASKGTALKWICSHCGEEDLKVIAAGDYDNDESMIRAADFGVAIGSGRARLKAAADYITVDNDHDPIADILKEIDQRCQ